MQDVPGASAFVRPFILMDIAQSTRLAQKVGGGLASQAMQDVPGASAFVRPFILMDIAQSTRLAQKVGGGLASQKCCANYL
jgi:hypothetical protein